jgi:cell division protein FtsI/penicillin-binding protein 2
MFFDSKIEKKRIHRIFLCFFIIFSLLFLRLYYLTYMKGDKLSIMADSQYSYTEINSELNYEMTDIKGNKLLDYYYKYYLIIDPLLFNNNFSSSNTELKALNYILKGNKNPINIYDENILSQSLLKKFSITADTYNKLLNIKNVKGFYYYKEKCVDRSYAWKIENIISDYYDTTENKQKDLSSLEGRIHSLYEKKYTTVSFQRDEEGYISLKSEDENSDNLVQLTLDKKLQDTVRTILNKTKYKQVGCAVMETSTGNILALAQKNEKMPNILIGASGELLLPGSTFKLIVAEAALENNIIKTDDKFTCKGILEKDGHKYHGTIDIKKALTISCNDVFIQIGIKTGIENIKDMAEKQGLLKKTLGLYYENKGYFGDTDNISLTSIGQNIYVSPLELLASINTIANNGYYVEPNILSSSEKKTSKVLSDSTVQTLKEDLRSVVVSGTGIRANNSKTIVYGKTGTTEYIINKENKSDGIFMGFFNKGGKYYSMIVVVKDIDRNNEDGGSTAAGIFNTIINNFAY